MGGEPTGEIIAGYEVTGELGKGTAGRVVRARQKTLNRVVALKLLDPRVARDRTTLDRFLREARALAPLRHPNVASLIDVGQDPSTGQHFIAFELVEGPSVEQLLTEKKKLPEEEALRIALGVAEGLTCSEAHRVVHRDVQPANILLAPDGTPKLIDMGLAKRLDESGSITVGGLITTPHYVSPEQAMELDSLDVRADLYALGITLFRMITGRLPFEGDGFLEVVTRHINEDVPDPRTVSKRVSEGVSRVIMGLCARDRDARYATARAAANDLQRVLDGAPPLGPERAGEAVVRAAPSSDGGDDDVGGGPAAESGVGGASELLKGVPFRVLVTSPDGPPIERTFDQAVVTIGRDPSCDLHINDKTVSRRHAELLRNGPTFALSARETANGTFVNEKLVKELVLLAPTDELRIAEKYRLRVTALGRAEEAGGWADREDPTPRPRETFVQDPADDADYSRRQAAGEEVGRAASGRNAGQKTPSSTNRPPGAKTPSSTNRPNPPSSPATPAATRKPPSSVSVPATKIPKPQASRPPAEEEDDPYAPRPTKPAPKPAVADDADPYGPTPIPTVVPPVKAHPAPQEEEEGETLSPFARRAPKSEPKSEPKPAPKAEPRAEPKASPKPEPRPAPKPEPRTTPKAEPRPTPKAEETAPYARDEAPRPRTTAPTTDPHAKGRTSAPSTDPHAKGRAPGPTVRVDPALAREAAQREAAQREAAKREAAQADEPRTEVALRADLGLPPAVKTPPRPAPEPVDTTPFLRVERKGGPSGPEGLVFHAQGQRKRVPLAASFVVGRGPGCDLVLRHPHAPRAAALVVRGADGATLFNVAPSPVIVTVNGAPVAGEHRLAHGDAIEVYGAQLTFEAR